jgi:hypothetical protein
MDGRQVRHLASGALLAGSLVSGGTVGNVLLLGSAEHRGDPVGRLSAHLGKQFPAPTARGAGAETTRLVVRARGSRATIVLAPARVTTIARTSVAPAPPPPVTTKPVAPATTVRVVVKTAVARTQPSASKGARVVTTNPVVTTQPTVAKGSDDHAANPEVTQPVETHPVETHPVEDHSLDHARDHRPDD